MIGFSIVDRRPRLSEVEDAGKKAPASDSYNARDAIRDVSEILKKRQIAADVLECDDDLFVVRVHDAYTSMGAPPYIVGFWKRPNATVMSRIKPSGDNLILTRDLGYCDERLGNVRPFDDRKGFCYALYDYLGQAFRR